jgi:uncharacterized peroxidase-related enzyme
VHQLARDWRQVALSDKNRALCEFAAKLTHTSHTMTEDDINVLRQHGFDDQAIHDAVQVISYMNYINRVADALGVEPERFNRPWEESPEPLDK